MPNRNNSGRFMSRGSSSSSKRSTQRSSSSGGRVMHLTSPSQAGAMEALIQRGPMTIMLVYSTSCPHCHTYMPLWKQLCRQRQRKANMVSMEADVYQQTPMAAKKEVSGVPTVLFVDKEGRITEGEDIRNTRMMTTAVQRGISEADLNSLPNITASTANTASASSTSSMNLSEPPTPGSRVLANLLPSLPAQVVPSPQKGGALPTQSGGALPTQSGGALPTQHGGNPWAAFLAAARQAAPAVALVGAYGLLPSRSSGLGPARRSRKTQRRNRSAYRA